MTSTGGYTPELLAKAILRGDTDSVQHHIMQLERKNIWWFNVLHPKTSDSALHVAIRLEYMPIIKSLCESCHMEDDERRFSCKTCSQMLEVGNKVGKKALHEAAVLCNTTIITYLLEIGAKVDSLKSGDWTPLMLVCVKNGLKAARSVELLLEGGANPLLTNKDGWTPLHLACRTGNLEAVQVLLAYCTEAIKCTSCNGRTPLHIACLHGHRAIVEELFKYGCSVDPVDACGLTPLHETVRGGHISLFRFLISKGADVRKTDGMELTCLHIAASSARHGIIETLLLEFGFDVDEATKTDKLTPLHCAVRAGHSETVRILKICGANPHIEDARGRQGVDFCNGCDTEEMMAVLATVN